MHSRPRFDDDPKVRFEADRTRGSDLRFDGGMTLPPPLVRVFRSGHLESVHRGAFVVVEDGRPVLTRGDGTWVSYYRSTSKPLQALVGITSGAADRFDLTPAELALAAGSHSTRPEHVATARSILAKAGIPEAALRCGGHYAFDPEIRRRQKESGDPPIPVWSNCSGKHALMLATARHLGAPLDTYTEPDHPVQRAIREHIAAFGGIDVAEVVVGVDGCSVPSFAVPLVAMARSLARLGRPEGVSDELRVAATRITEAMGAHPEMVGGEGRFDTDLIREPRARLVAKAGAEGVHGVWAPDRGLGLAVKAEDGADRGYRLVVVELLRRLRLLDDTEAQAIRRRYCDPEIRTIAGEVVGRMEAVLDG